MIHSRSQLIALSCSIAITVVSGKSTAEISTPFYTVNQNPLIQLHGLPPLEKGQITATGTTTSWTTLIATNNSISENTQQESIIFDGETYRLNIMLRHGLKKRVLGVKGIEIGIDIPYITHSRGILDRFIINWHDAFGFSNSERDPFQNNQLRYEYSRNGITQLRIVDTTNSIGDIRLSAAWQLRCKNSPEQHCTALRAGLKLPTGKPSRLSGSGSADFSLALTHSRTHQRYTFHYGGGLLLNGRNDLLHQQQKHAVGFVSVGLNYQTQRYSWMTLKVQLDGHSAFYNSALNNLGSNSLQINMGGTIQFSNKVALDISVLEDIITSTIPDVAFHFALRIQHQK